MKLSALCLDCVDDGLTELQQNRGSVHGSDQECRLEGGFPGPTNSYKHETGPIERITLGCGGVKKVVDVGKPLA